MYEFGTPSCAVQPLCLLVGVLFLFFIRPLINANDLVACIAGPPSPRAGVRMSWELDGFSDFGQSSGDEGSSPDEGSDMEGLEEEERHERFVRAVLRGDTGVVCRLLAWSPSLAKAREPRYPCRSVVACAAVEGEGEMVQALLGAGADVEGRDLQGSTALLALCGREEGCGRGQREALQALLQAGADVWACRNDGGGALAVAAGKGHVGMVRLLLPHYRGARGKRAVGEGLWDACVEGEVRMVEVLVRDGGGDVWAQQGDAGTPIQAAREQRHTHVLNWIQVGRRRGAGKVDGSIVFK